MRISISNVKFHKHVASNSGGSGVCGYFQKGTLLNFHCDSGSTSSMELRGVRVKRNSKGELQLAAPSTTWTDDDGNERRTPMYKFDDATYEAIRKVVGALPEVREAWNELSAAVAPAPVATAPAGIADQLVGLAKSNPNELDQLIGQLLALKGATSGAPAPSADPFAAGVEIDV